MRRYTLYSAVIATVLTLAASAKADFMFGDTAGTTTPGNNQEIDIKVTLFEPALDQVNGVVSANNPTGNDELYGVGYVTGIYLHGSSQAVWLPTSTQGLTFTFDNYKFDSVGAATQTTANSQGFAFTGGNTQLYFQPGGYGSGISNPQQLGSNSNPDPTGTFTNGTPVLTTQGAPSNVLGDTLIGSFNTDVTSANYGRGSGSGLETITSALGQLANLAPNLSIVTDLFPVIVNNAPVDETKYYAVNGDDPITGTVVPEPTSIVMVLSAGIAGACGLVRRRRKQQLA